MFTFLPITLLLYYVSPRVLKNSILLLASLIFYAWGEPIYVFLMIGTILIDYLLAILIDRNRDDYSKCKWIFILTIILNVSILGFFKYFGFFVNNINSIFNLNIPFDIVDVYLGKVEVQYNLINFATYVTMFPQLVAGPIVQYQTIEEQLNTRQESVFKFGEGVERFIQGLGKKILLANNIGMLWTTISSLELSSISVLTAWLGIIAYTFQIYFDFSAYSDMAIGLGKMFGFEFMENFNYPYISKSVTEFWRRWHISLGTWFREYIYIPLGGNRVSVPKQIRNIFVVWALTGLWHGANWNFVVWGLYYGILLLIEKFVLKSFLEKVPDSIKHTYTMLFVIVGWLFFASEDLGFALDYLKIMFFASGNTIVDTAGIYYLYTNIVMFAILIVFSTPIIKRTLESLAQKYRDKLINPSLVIYGLVLFLVTAYLVNETYNPFLYFRF